MPPTRKKSPATTERRRDKAEPDSDQAAFAQRLRAVANKLGGVRALAAAAGVFPSSAGDWFQGAEPRRDALTKIARAANVSLDWLMLGGDYAPLRFYDLQKSQGFNEMFLARDREQRAAGQFETRIFDLSALVGPLAAQNERLLIARMIETWRDPLRAQANLFMMVVGGSGDSMAPLIRDGDVVVVAESSGTEADWRPGRSVSYPCVISHRGKVIVRLVRYGPKGTAIGPLEKSAWPPKMAKPEYVFEGALFAAGEVRSGNGEFFMLGRVIWCGGSLLAFDYSGQML